MSLNQLDLPYILIVDDDPDCRQLTALALEEIEGHLIRTAIHGADAIRIMELNGVPALVVTDMTMPIMGGSRLIKEMRGNDRLKAVPVVILSGDSFLNENVIAMTVLQLKKPCSKDEIIRVVKSLLKLF